MTTITERPELVAETKPEPRPRIEIVLVGKTLSVQKKVVFAVRKVEGGKLVGDEFYLSGFSGGIGCVYSFEYEPGETFRYYASTQRFVGQWKDDSDRAVWQAQARAFDIEQAAIRERKKAEGVNDMLDALEPLRRRYQKTNATGKLAIEVLLLSYLRRVEIGGDR